MTTKIYAIESAGPLTYEWRGCWDAENHQIDSENPDFVCPFDLIERYGYVTSDRLGKPESDDAYAHRVRAEFEALLGERALAATKTELPPALSLATSEITPSRDLAAERADLSLLVGTANDPGIPRVV